MASKVAPARTAGTMLRRIEEFLLTAPTDEGRMLWDIMTALRGSDHPSDDLPVKEEVTARIRTLAFPGLAYRDGAGFMHGALFASREDAATQSIRVFRSFSYHFAHHASAALNALRVLGRTNQKGS